MLNYIMEQSWFVRGKLKMNKEKSIHAVFSNRSDDWSTPDEIYSYLERIYGIPKMNGMIHVLYIIKI